MRKLVGRKAWLEALALVCSLSFGVNQVAVAAEAPNRDVEFPHGLTSFRQYGPVGPYYPERADRMNLHGSAQINCHVNEKRQLSDCRVAAETPPEAGFGEAALRMASQHWILAAKRLDGAAEAPDERGVLTIEFRRYR